MATTASLLVATALMLNVISMTTARFLDVTDRCPQPCSCDRDLHKAVCLDGSLTGVPRTLPPSIQYLDLTGNNITALCNDSLSHLPDLRYLSLSDNGINSIADTSFIAQGSLHKLDLSHNQLTETDLNSLQHLNSIAKLDLSRNLLSTVPKEMLVNKSLLEELDFSYNRLSNISLVMLERLPNLLLLNLSHNYIEHSEYKEHTDYKESLSLNDTVESDIKGTTGNYTELISRLQVLDISHNNLSVHGLPCDSNISNSPSSLKPLLMLTKLLMGSNHNISNLKQKSFESCPSLKHLEISHMDGLKFVDMEAFSGLSNLRTLDLSHNCHLSYLHAHTFSNLTNISKIDLSQNGLTSINDATFSNLTELEVVHLMGNPWICDCDSHWMGPLLTTNSSSNTSPLSASDFVCASPPEVAGLHLVDILPSFNFSCHRAYVVNHTHTTAHAVGSSAVLNCVAAGDPSPAIVWITPHKDVIHYHPAFVHPGRPGPESAIYHTGHSWHGSSEYTASLPTSARRMHVLPNGSLYIDYVQRHDAGRYTCLVHNRLGNDSVVVSFHLNYLIISRTMVQSMIIGFLCAAVFLAFGLITALIRYLVFTCSREQRQKRKSVREILDSLETFRSDKMDKLSAYKTAKIDQLAAFKTAKVDKLRGYKNITVTTLLHYLHRSREHYTNQTVHIKENCAQQAERLRESYSMQKLKFKDYRSHQIEKIKDNYNGQLLKIRLYGSGQLERLRDQYRLQQQHILKLLELLDIGNCMTVLEAECLRTDSMIFENDLSFDLEAAVYAPRSRSCSVSGSEYMTAGDNSDQSSPNSNSGSVIFEVKLDESPTSSPLDEKVRAESVSSTTLTQLKVDLAAAGIKINRSSARESRDSKKATGGVSANSGSATDNSKLGNNGSQSKGRQSRKKHRHKHPPVQRQDTPELEDEGQFSKRPRQRRVSSKDRREKREQKDRQSKNAQVKIQDKPDFSPKTDTKYKASQVTLSNTAEVQNMSNDNPRKESENSSVQNSDSESHIALGIDLQAKSSPVRPASIVTIENEMETLKGSTPSPVSPHHRGVTLREQWHQDKDHPSTDVPSTDYESAQEPESRGNTPQVGFYEHTGSPQSFASFPSTPSTPTLRDFHPVVILDPAELDRSIRTEARESEV